MRWAGGVERQCGIGRWAGGVEAGSDIRAEACHQVE